VVSDEREYVIFSPSAFDRYHAEIVQRFCQDMGIAGVYNMSSKSFDIVDPSWRVVGGGRFEIDRRGHSLRLYDTSAAYGRFEGDRLERILRASPQFSRFTITIE